MPDPISWAALRQVALAPAPPPAPSDAAAQVARYLATIAPAYAERTLSGLASDWRVYSAWCRSNACTALGATPAVIQAYMAALAPTHAPGTIRRHLATISHLHRAFGLANPVASREVHLAWRQLTRQHDIRPARRRMPLRREDIEQLLAGLGDSLIGRRDRALLLVARDSLARRSELARLAVEDISWRRSRGGAEILIRRAKNDPEGEGRLTWLAPATAAALRAYLEAAGHRQGALFRQVIDCHQGGGPLQPRAIARRFKAMARRAGLDAATIGGHSTRLGMTLDLVADRQSLAAIQLAGGWRSPAMPALYARQLLPELGAVARYYEARLG